MSQNASGNAPYFINFVVLATLLTVLAGKICGLTSI